MVEKINNEELYKFLDEVFEVVVFNKKDTKEASLLFTKQFSTKLEDIETFLNALPNIKTMLSNDLDFFMLSDPAVNSKDEVILAYPGFKAIASYRIAHELFANGFLLKARMITERAHTLTGIDIHPGANIASPFFIDHGTGIVIGETAIIGKNVKLYQGVTLGALSLSRGAKMKGVKRHPTVGNNVTIYSGASILGDVKIGDNVTIGSNVFLTEDVPSNMKVIISKPELILLKKRA